MVAEVVANDERLRIDPLTIPALIHYLVCDAGGDCASIDFLDLKGMDFIGGRPVQFFNLRFQTGGAKRFQPAHGSPDAYKSASRR
jgi:hypothetical protein